MQKKLALSIMLAVTLSISAPAMASRRDRDTGSGDPSPITRIVQVLKRLFGVHPTDQPAIPIP